MITTDSSNAQVVMLLASNDVVEIARLQRDLSASRIRYDFAVLHDRANLLGAIVDKLSAIGGSLPLVLVLDYKFAGADCDVLLRTVQSFPNAAAIACIVTNPPLEAALRQSLMASGVRLFDEGEDTASAQLTLQ